jgi:hypothetical protein
VKRFRAIIAVLFVLTAVAGVLFALGYMPGTITRLENGKMHGTGTWVHHYESGDVMLQEEYLAGKLRFSRWFRPDGHLIAETKWRRGRGTNYVLRENGTIAQKLELRGGRVQRVTYFEKDGVSVERIVDHPAGKAQ